ncbi:uncharacterized protein LOC120212367 [Hibiscus syriacus]|uniref:uncharacterized protein LOC120212367 n=1 Tax=Hibiscus syriacus TaxID=106335 RepID=UPI0019239E1C|nr:uncharacterized protein LOC120212367 [Hibiscus syriacus]
MWALKQLNFDLDAAGQQRMLKINELQELRNNAYEISYIYKKKSKKWNDQHIIPREFHDGQQALLFNLRLKLFPGKLRSRWSGPFEILEVFSQGVILLKNLVGGSTFKVNRQRLKHYSQPYNPQISSKVE